MAIRIDTTKVESVSRNSGIDPLKPKISSHCAYDKAILLAHPFAPSKINNLFNCCALLSNQLHLLSYKYKDHRQGHM